MTAVHTEYKSVTLNPKPGKHTHELLKRMMGIASDVIIYKTGYQTNQESEIHREVETQLKQMTSTGSDHVPTTFGITS